MDIPSVQIHNGKAKFVVVPNNIAVLNLKNFEKVLVKEFSCHRISRTIQESTEINGSFRLIGKLKMNFVLSQIRGLCDGNGFHGDNSQIFFVIISEETGLL